MDSKSKTNSQSRREFLTSSAGLLVAGAVGGLPFSAAAAAPGSEPRTPFAADSPAHRIILDTDPGIDDALAILLALRSPELKVEAITPVAGNVPLELTLPNALRLVEIAGRTDVPVAAGASSPLIRQLVTAKYVHGENGLAGVDFGRPKIRPVAESASDLIRRIVHSNPGEITIVAIGPLTNVATALRADPSLAAKIRNIVIMGGSLSGGNITPSAEFNLYVDPEAARIVFEAGVPLTMVGLDVTRKVMLREEHVEALEAAQNPSSQAAGRIMRGTIHGAHLGKRDVVALMHDPLTVAYLIDPGILSLRDYYVQIETSGELTAGETVGYSQAPVRKSAPFKSGAVPASPSADSYLPNAKVAVEVDPERFFNLFLGRLTAAA